jgi:tetratricopeptide (TPR) repeat protein
MLGIIIVVGALIGLAAIYYIKLEETKKKDRLKVTMTNAEIDEPKNIGKVGIDPNSWKRKNLDFKAINDAFSKAELLYSKNDLDAAMRGFIFVLSLHPENTEATNKLGLIYLKKGMLNKAETTFRQLVEMDAKNPIYYSNLGLAYYSQGKLEEARENYEKAIQLDPRKASRYINLGQVCVDLKDWKKAIRAYSKAIELTPKNLDLYFTVTDLLIKVSAFDEALAFMNALLEVNPYNDTAKERIREIKMLKGTSPLTNQGKPIDQPVKNKKNQQSFF